MTGISRPGPARARPESPDSVTSHGEIPAKRRKVRKGTRSCWECKRRKIRCIFASSEDDTCSGCRHRRAPCVTQELPEDLAPEKKGNRHLSDRISRVEDFMKEYLAGNDAGSRTLAREPCHDGRARSYTLGTPTEEPTPSSSRTLLDGAEGPESSLETQDSPDEPDRDESDAVLRHLLAAFPSEDDALILLKESAIPSLYMEAVNTQPHSKLTRETLAAPYSLPELPGPNTHPVMVAKLMLMFAITLQSPTGKEIVGLSQAQGVLRRRLVLASTTWVTANGEMHGTVDSLICIILEGVYEVNAGNLRQGWAVYRRALTVAQLMGLHRSPVPPLKRIDSKLDVNAEFLWFRIIYMDRYLSLLLGLPQGTSDKRMGEGPHLQHEPPLGIFERQLTVIACHILERNSTPFAVGDSAITQAIDSELLQLSKCMPASFWRPANFHSLTPGSPDALLETVRLSAQVYYFGLLIQLHLPYMMAIGGNVAHEYSRLTCVNASREIMTRFIAHRTFNPVSSCSRPVDFFALMAGMTVLLAHIDGNHYRGGTNYMAHQRLSDCAMLGQALERMDIISRVNKDKFTEESAKLLRRLLVIEADAAEGSTYTTSSVGGDEQAQEVEKEYKDLRLRIPYLGVVRIARQGPISGQPPHNPPLAISSDIFTFPPQDLMSDHLLHVPESEQPMLQCPIQGNMTSLQSHDETPPITAGIDDWTFQGVDMAFFDSLMRSSSVDGAGLEQQWMDYSAETDTNNVSRTR